jgi:putative oxidoreductase
MLAYIRRPHADLAAVILRLGLAFLFIGYGYMKVSQDRAMTEHMSFGLQTAVGWTELICGILLAIGLFPRLAALGIIVDMCGAIYLVTGKRDLFGADVGPHGETFKPGYEYNLLIIVVCLALIAMGGGVFSLNHLIFGRRQRTTSVAVPTPQVPAIPPAPVVKT